MQKMKQNRREFLKTGTAAAATNLVGGSSTRAADKRLNGRSFTGKRLGSILNVDINGLLSSMSGGSTTVDEYRRGVNDFLNFRPGMVSQNVGLPDPVIYRTSVATLFSKYLVDVALKTWAEVWGPRDKATKEQVRAGHQQQVDAMNRFLEAGTDPLTVVIEECRKR